ncbi:helix-turn-helix transcriptional regulator [Acidisoma cellulosilytica]|uniref:Helix-turn-helix transcriptional regulator n=1 Tax=Acidisoma cellulosilyticum TaxID=2802395 RepID=A0A963Z4A3_9PROT|nr:helix-turn-helix transcriptional regulator [Acidisoma cellulosilyticum]MCB8882354.1 helix-turn-helix transcriptional regulator [Acidisoma cellulosilyticum]
MLEPDLQDAVHQLWDELADFDARETEATLRHLQEALCRLAGPWNVRWTGAVRVNKQFGDDPLEGWRMAVLQILHPMPPLSIEPKLKEIAQLWDRRKMDPSFLLPIPGVGSFRTYSFRRQLPPDWFDSPFYEHFYGSRGIYDALYVGFPLNANAESHFGFYAREKFTDKQILLLSYALRGIKWFHRRLMLSHGLLIASSPLTPTEHRVLALLLTKGTETQIAHQLGLATSTTHQHVVALFSKFGVRSRAGLMSLWLNGG